MVSTVVQLGGVLVLAGLFVLLRRFVLRRAYFSAWTSAWLALTAALAAIVARYNVLPAMAGGPVADGDVSVRIVYYVYQLAKLAAFAWFVDGTRTYVLGRRGLGRSRWLWAGVLLYAIASVTLAPSQATVVVWQAPLAVAGLGYCAHQLLHLPRLRRTAGTLASGGGFAFLAVLWTVYAVVFGLDAFRQADVPTFAWFIITSNPYLDLAGSIALGYGMILVLMEDSKREVDDAQAALRAAHDGLRRAALYDPLTGIMNRSAFTEGLGLDMARASHGTVVLLDLDNLKEVNDEFGHAAGDMLLRVCSDTLKAALRQTDRLYRWGGDEFLLVLPMARAADIQRRFEQVIVDASPLQPGVSPRSVRLAASVGAADFASFDDLRSAIDRADSLMYQQKHQRKRISGGGGRPATPVPPEPAVS
jgi:diguanylate cyclase (GGDEF)-like protein